jgi:hypothetical protein
MPATPAHEAFHAGLLLTTIDFGFRHGIEWDHIGALADITSSQDQSRRSMWFATLYALGHAERPGSSALAPIAMSTRPCRCSQP